MSLLEVSGLSTVYRTGRGPLKAVDEVSFSLERGQVLGIVGESGCGKTTLAMSLLRLVKSPGKIVAGAVVFDGENLFSRPRAQMRHVRGARICLVPQAAMNALDPAYSARSQVAEVIRAHNDVPRRKAAARAAQLLESLAIPSDRVGAYPHELSGGMRQRVAIAMALANDPMLVIADEPVTGLDVIVQASILDLLSDLRQRRELSMIFISHDLLAVARISDQLLVMYAGRVVEHGPTTEVVGSPRHPYTQALLAAFPRLDGPRELAASVPGEVPDLINRPPGCPFHDRCPAAFNRCHDELPKLIPAEGARVACHLYA